MNISLMYGALVCLCQCVRRDYKIQNQQSLKFSCICLCSFNTQTTEKSMNPHLPMLYPILIYLDKRCLITGMPRLGETLSYVKNSDFLIKKHHIPDLMPDNFCAYCGLFGPKLSLYPRIHHVKREKSSVNTDKS